MTEPQDLSELICATIALACNGPRESVSPATSLFDLNIDSIALLAVIAHIESVCGVAFSTNDMFDLREVDCVGELIARIHAVIDGDRSRIAG